MKLLLVSPLDRKKPKPRPRGRLLPASSCHVPGFAAVAVERAGAISSGKRKALWWGASSPVLPVPACHPTRVFIELTAMEKPSRLFIRPYAQCFVCPLDLYERESKTMLPGSGGQLQSLRLWRQQTLSSPAPTRTSKCGTNVNIPPIFSAGCLRVLVACVPINEASTALRSEGALSWGWFVSKKKHVRVSS